MRERIGLVTSTPAAVLAWQLGLLAATVVGLSVVPVALVAVLVAATLFGGAWAAVSRAARGGALPRSVVKRCAVVSGGVHAALGAVVVAVLATAWPGELWPDTATSIVAVAGFGSAWGMSAFFLTLCGADTGNWWNGLGSSEG